MQVLHFSGLKSVYITDCISERIIEWLIWCISICLDNSALRHGGECLIMGICLCCCSVLVAIVGRRAIHRKKNKILLLLICYY